MSLHRDWTDVADAGFVLVTRDTATDEIACPIDASHALFVGDGNGDGLVIEGDPTALARWVDLLHTHVHQAITADSETPNSAGQEQPR